MKYMILDKKHRLVETDLETWAESFHDNDTRRVARDTVGKADVSTVFLGVDHSFGGEKPLWFETMIFGGQYDEWQRRYTTWDEALAGHKKIVADLRARRVLR